jgi:deoxyribodipyrimidine photolyase
MNAARLTRRWQEAAGDPARMVEALVDEINDPATGLVTRDFLRAELAQVRTELATLRGELAILRGETISAIAELESRLTWRMITMLGVQIALVGIMVTILVQVLR